MIKIIRESRVGYKIEVLEITGSYYSLDMNKNYKT